MISFWDKLCASLFPYLLLGYAMNDKEMFKKNALECGKDVKSKKGYENKWILSKVGKKMHP